MTKPKKSVTRRRGAESSEARAKLIAAASRLIIEEGYAAVTTRRVAARAGLKPQLVHYYFPTMDDLLVAVIRSGGDRHLQELTKAVASEHPLRAMWSIGTDSETAILSTQFMALATHREAVREEVKRYAEQLRLMQAAALTRYLERHGIDPKVAPIAVILLTTSVSSVLLLEKTLGISLGHAEMRSFIADGLRRLEGPQSVQPVEPPAIKGKLSSQVHNGKRQRAKTVRARP